MRDITNFFPYFFLFYLLTFILSSFSILWESFWKVPMLHISFIIFGLVFAFEKLIPFYIDKINFENSGRKWNGFSEFFYKTKYFFKTFLSGKNILSFLRSVILLVYKFIFWLICLIKFFGSKMIVFCWKTLKSFWNKIKEGYFVSWSGGLALFFLALCPFLLVFKKDALAEKSAIYAYYFLVISVILIIIENFSDKKSQTIEEIEETDG